MEDPTPEMWRALLDFRTRHGRFWKRALLLKWMNGGDEAEPYSASLRMLRNQFGPTWLYALRPAALHTAQHRFERPADRETREGPVSTARVVTSASSEP